MWADYGCEARARGVRSLKVLYIGLLSYKSACDLKTCVGPFSLLLRVTRMYSKEVKVPRSRVTSSLQKV